MELKNRRERCKLKTGRGMEVYRGEGCNYEGEGWNNRGKKDGSKLGERNETLEGEECNCSRLIAYFLDVLP